MQNVVQPKEHTVFDNNNRSGGAGNNSGYGVEPSKSSGTSPPVRSSTKLKAVNTKVKLGMSESALDLLMKSPLFVGQSRQRVKAEFLEAMTDRVRNEIEATTKEGHLFWLSLTEIPDVTIVNFFDFQPRPKKHPLRNTVMFMAPWEAIEDAQECGFMPALESLLLRRHERVGAA